MLSLAVRNTAKLIREKSKSENIRLGRLFTKKDTARLMAGMFTLTPGKRVYTLLDPGAGTGILSAALIEHICQQAQGCEQIFLTCYENDPIFVPMLEDNLERIRRKCRHDYGIRLFATVYAENYLTDARNHYTVAFFDAIPDRFDMIICHPPLGLLDRESPEAEAVGGVTQLRIGAPFLFAELAKTHLEADGQLVIMLPTTVASASQLTAFRQRMHDGLSLQRVHLFVARQKNPRRAVPLKKEIILSYRAAAHPETVTVSTSTDAGTPAHTVTLPPLPYDFVVDPTDGSLTLPKSVEDTKIVRYINAFPETLASLGLKISTGLIIDSKCQELLISEPVRGAVPLIRPSVLSGGSVDFPGRTGKQYIAPINPALLQKNKNMLLIKRVPAKSDARFLNVAVYLAAKLPTFRYISTHNKLNFIDTRDPNGEICARLAFGLFALLNSTIYDRYLSIVSKSKQVNAKELRDLPLPPRNLIENMGMRLMAVRQTGVKACDDIVNPTLHIIEK